MSKIVKDAIRARRQGERDAAKALLAALDAIAGNIGTNDTGELIALYVTREDADAVFAAIAQAKAAGIE